MKRKVQVWIHRDGRVLLLRTLPTRGAFWQPVTGSVEEGETLEAAALREAAEETGLRYAARPKAIGYEFSYETRGGKKIDETAFALAAPAGEIRLDAHEHDDHRWVTVAEANDLLRYDSNRDALHVLVLHWGKHA
jgi:ADP-ribose pyrophosphatase YjhB (NUDIX family)